MTLRDHSAKDTIASAPNHVRSHVDELEQLADRWPDDLSDMDAVFDVLAELRLLGESVVEAADWLAMAADDYQAGQ